MNSNNSNLLSLIHPDDIDYHSQVSNMPFDESIEFTNSDYMSSEVLEISDETNDFNFNELSHFIRDDDKSFNQVFHKKMVTENTDIFNLLPPSPISEDEIDQKTYKRVFYADAMDMEEAIRKDTEILKTNLNFNGVNLGNGKMDYIKNKHEKLMMTNAWQAITQTKTWDFIAQDISSFMFSNNPKINLISNKMCELGYNEHSGLSFSCVMRNMQYLVKNGEENFKKLYVDEIPTPDAPRSKESYFT